MNKKYIQFLMSLFLFVILAAIRQTSFITKWDNHFYVWAMQLSYNKMWILFWEFVSFIGSGPVVYSVMALAMAYFVYKNQSRVILLYITLMIACFLANPLLKLAFAIDRPVSLSPYTELQTYTFPSGHSVNSVVFFYFFPRLAFYFLGERLPAFLTTRVFAAIGIVIIGMSRILLGAHWFSDVLGGWLFGFVIATFLLILLKKMQRDVKKEMT